MTRRARPGLPAIKTFPARLGLAFATSSTSTLGARVIASNYERNIDSAETDSLGVQFDWTSRLSDSTQWYVRVGAKEVDVPSNLQGATDSGSETGFEGGIGADWTFQVTRLFIDATASVEPNASGRIIQRDQLRFRLERQFGPRTNGWVGARYQRDTALTEDIDAFNDRDYATGTLGFEWRMTRDFSLRGTVRSQVAGVRERPFGPHRQRLPVVGRLPVAPHRMKNIPIHRAGILTLAMIASATMLAVTPVYAQQLPDYSLHPGDEIEVSVWKEVDLQRKVIIRPDGKFAFPLTGEIIAVGRTAATVQSEIEEKLKAYIPEPVVTVSVTGIAGNQIYVIGQVTKPGAYVMNPQISILQALSLAGGMTPFAATNDIIVIRSSKGSQRVLQFQYGDVSKGRSLDQNVMLESGDVVVVP